MWPKKDPWAGCRQVLIRVIGERTSLVKILAYCYSSPTQGHRTIPINSKEDLDFLPEDCDHVVIECWPRGAIVECTLRHFHDKYQLLPDNDFTNLLYKD